MKKYFVAYFIAPNLPAEYPRDEIPLHVTVIYPFETDLPEEDLAARLSASCSRHAPIVAAWKSREMLGPDRDIPVAEFHCPPELSALRADLLQAYGDAITHVGAPHPTFRPHVTDQRGAAVAEGESLALDALSLIEKTGDRRVVIGTFPLSGE